MVLTKEDFKEIQICRVGKSRYYDKRSCPYCNKPINVGDIVIGKGWLKVCLDCAEKRLTRHNNSINEFLDTIAKTRADLKLNMEKYKAKNIANSI